MQPRRLSRTQSGCYGQAPRGQARSSRNLGLPGEISIITVIIFCLFWFMMIITVVIEYICALYKCFFRTQLSCHIGVGKIMNLLWKEAANMVSTLRWWAARLVLSNNASDVNLSSQCDASLQPAASSIVLVIGFLCGKGHKEVVYQKEWRMSSQQVQPGYKTSTSIIAGSFVDSINEAGASVDVATELATAAEAPPCHHLSSHLHHYWGLLSCLRTGPQLHIC